jgi:luciferase family oxidoreductase group 1
LRRTLVGGEDRFAQDVLELQAYLGDPDPNAAVQAIPGQGTGVPLWMLGSSTYGAQLAAMLGLPYAFASHFAPALLHEALHIYRETFRPSAQLDRPYAMVAVNVFAAPTDAEAQLISTSTMQAFLNLRRGTPTRLKPPDPDLPARLTPSEKAMLDQIFACSAVGGPETVQRRLDAIISETGADELILAANIYDHTARLRSFEIAAEVRMALAA